MAEIVKGADVKASLVEKMKAKIAETGVEPCLGIVRVGEKAADLSYEKGVIKTCDSVGIKTKITVLPEDIDQASFEAEFMKVNDDPSVHGILLFRPLPAQLDDQPIVQMINPEKDMDCMSPANWAKLAMGDESGYFPCTPEAVMKICDYMGVEFEGKNAVIIGHSLVVGRPLGYMMIAKNASVSWCHVYTQDTVKRCEDADILVCACGVPGLIKAEHVAKVHPGCVAIDVGINFVNGKMCGDFDFEQVEPHVAKITPVPGGVGAVTNSIMASHVVRAAVKAKTGEVFNF